MELTTTKWQVQRPNHWTTEPLEQQSRDASTGADLGREVDGEHAVRDRVELAEDALRHGRLPGTDRTDEHHREVAGDEAAHKVRVAHSVDGGHDQLVERQATTQRTSAPYTLQVFTGREHGCPTRVSFWTHVFAGRVHG